MTGSSTAVAREQRVMKIREFIPVYCGAESTWILAGRDISESLGNYKQWLFLSWQHIRQRYRRSVLGK